MLFTYYKNNQPAVLFLLPVVIVVLWAPGFSTQLSTPAITGFFLARFMQYLIGDTVWLGKAIAIVLILAGAVLFNRIFNKNDFLNRDTYLPAFLYVLFCSFFIQIHQLHPLLFSNLFLLLCLDKILAQ